MADVFVDCEWIQGEDLTILGAYSLGQSRFQLHGKRLTRNRFSRFLNRCCERSRYRYTFFFCHGPDIGRIRKKFNLKLKESFYCINTITAFRDFTQFSDVSLGHLEWYFGLPRKYALSSSEIRNFWNSNSWWQRKIVLEYNWEDCVNLWRLVNILKNRYKVTRSDFKRIAMPPWTSAWFYIAVGKLDHRSDLLNLAYKAWKQTEEEIEESSSWSAPFGTY